MHVQCVLLYVAGRERACVCFQNEKFETMKLFHVFYVGLHKKAQKTESAEDINVLLRRSKCRQE